MSNGHGQHERRTADLSYDCVVMGGGPAGSTAATLIAQAGYRTLLLEREAMPRFHVGESLMPETYWTFERLGVLDKMRSSSFVKKVSVQFVSHAGKESSPFSFQDHDPRECSQTWQVRRAEFDQMLFENAAEHGAECRDQTRVLSVDFAGDRAQGVELRTADGARQYVASRVLVDATGQQALIANALGLKQINPDLKKAAVWTYYRGAHRESGKHGGATVILHTDDKTTWFWYIPLADGITSVGVVGDHSYLLKENRSPAATFAAELDRCGVLQKWLAAAERADDFRVAREFSYTTQRAAGEGWVLVGDAWGFIDPIYSSGVYLAIKSGELAADAICAGLASGDLSAECLGSWLPDFKAGTEWIRKLVHAFYTQEFSFGRFMQQHPQYLGNLTDLLIGRIFQDSAGEIFRDLERFTRLPTE